MPTTETAAEPFTKAKRGDLALFTRPHSAWSLLRGRGWESWITYDLAIVVAATRGGVVKYARKRNGECLVRGQNVPGRCEILSQSKLTLPAADVLARVPAEFSSIDEAKAALLPFVAAEYARAE